MSRIMAEQANNPEEKNYAQWIHQSCKQLLNLLDDVLHSIATDNTNDNDVRVEPANLRNNLQDIVHLVFPMLKIKNIHLQIQIDESIPEILITDKIKLSRTLLYLLGNAINSSENGTITVKMDMLSNDSVYAQLRFSVIDADRIIADEFQSRIFEAAAANLLAEDNDVNLSTAQRYVSLLGGEIDLASESLTGTTFSFILSMKIGNML